MSGGSSETEVKALAVRPVGLPSASSVVMVVTPLAKWLSVRRNSSAEITVSL
jgi:hypothetical protein